LAPMFGEDNSPRKTLKTRKEIRREKTLFLNFGL
jgi:hypothetical protein